MSFYATIARYYDSEHREKDDDVPLYADLAEEADGAILIIGSGTGRLAVWLAHQGYTVHGIEIEPAMMERARARSTAPALHDKLYLHEGDARAVDLRMPGGFELVILPYNTFMHFHEQEEQIDLLQRVRGWLAPDGVFVIDLPNAGEAFAAQDTGAIVLERTFLDLETGHLVMQQSVSELDRTTQLMQVTWIYDEITSTGAVERTFVPVINRYFFEPEIRLLLRVAGLEAETIYGDFDGSPFEDGAPRMIVLARHPAAADDSE